MKRLLTVLLGVALIGMSKPIVASAADIVGTVTDAQGIPVSGLKLSALTQSEKELSSTTTGRDGSFVLSGLSDGDYLLKLATAGTVYQGQTVVTHVDSAGVTVNWKVSQGTTALALATYGASSSVGGSANAVAASSTAPVHGERRLRPGRRP